MTTPIERIVEKPIMYLFTLLLIFIMLPLYLSAQVSLDNSFSGDGKVLTDISGANDYGNGIAVQSDGKILVAGSKQSSGTWEDIAVTRYNTDGSLDLTFGTNGVASISTTSEREEAFSIAVQSDDKIVVSGTSNYDFVVVRFNADGSLDTGFGTSSGYSTFSIRVNDYANSVKIQKDGKIVVVGYGTAASPDSYMVVLRLTSSGGLDNTFSGDGKEELHITGSGTYGRAVEIDESNRIVVAGNVVLGSLGGDVAIARFTSSGLLDNSFDSDGYVYTDFGTQTNDYIYAVALDSNSNILVAGWSNDDFIILRYTSSGVLDNSFGNGGKVSTNVSGIDYAYSLAVQPDGKIVVAGESNNDFSMVRYLNDGSLDDTFGSNGKIITDFNSGIDRAKGILIDSNGNIYLGGSGSNGTNSDFAVAKYNYDLNPDVPALSSPNNNSVKQTTTTTLDWENAAGAASYNLQVSIENNFSSTVISETAIGTSTYDATSLSPGQTYYWRVNSENSHGTSDWSTAYSFKVQLSAPIVTSPSDGATGQNSNSTTIEWGSVSFANSYSYQLSTSNTFDPLISDISNHNSVSVTLNNLASNTTYYYRIKADDVASTNSSEWTTTRSFTTSLVPVVPTLTFPTNNAPLQGTTTNLTWEASLGADSYDVQVSTINDFSTTVISQAGITATTFDATGLSAGQTYYWRINATNTNGTSDWASAFSFVVQLATPVLTYPSNSATGISVNTTLQWEDVNYTDSYSCIVSPNSNLTSPIASVSNLGTSEYSLSGLSDFTTYYWAVKANNSAGDNSSSWSTTISFTTGGPTQIAGGNVSGTWLKADSPFEVNGDLSIIDGTTLTIEPGCLVRFKGSYQLDVKGRLIAQGTQTDSIKFTASNTTTGWKGFNFNSVPVANDSSFIEYSIIEYGIYDVSQGKGRGLSCNNFSKLKISNSRFSFCDNREGGAGNAAYIGSSDITISNTKFSNNLNSTAYGNIDLYCNLSSSVIKDNIFINNSDGTAIRFNSTSTLDTILFSGNTISNYRWGIYSRRSQQYATISNNTIANCSTYGIYIDNSTYETPTGNFIISNNTFKNMDYLAIQIEKSAIVKFDSNLVTNCLSAMYLNGASQITISNNIITNCGESSSGVIGVEGSSVLIENNTIAYNQNYNNASFPTNGGIRLNCTGSYQAVLKNNIIWGNSGPEINVVSGSNNPTMTYSITENTYAWETNCTHVDPLFVTPPAGVGLSHDGTLANYNLQSTSSAIDSGDPTYAVPDGGEPIIDIGAKEYINNSSSTNNSLDNTFEGNFTAGQAFSIASESGTVDCTSQLYLSSPPNNTDNKPNVGRYWDLSSTGNARIRLYYPSSATSGFAGSPTIFHYTGGNWVSVPTNQQQVDGNSSYVESTNPITSWSPFTVGDANDALPVELIGFTATLIVNKTHLSWQTATEVNNYGFEIERKNYINDNWENIGFVDGHGNSNSPNDYSFVDDNPIGNIISYRLKQIDTDGLFEYSEIVTVTSELPLEYKLSQNFPNPFNPSTKINFALPEKANLSLKVYNSIGEEVAELINSEMNAGYHFVNFDATNLASGIYFYRITSGNFTQTNKMLLIK